MKIHLTPDEAALFVKNTIHRTLPTNVADRIHEFSVSIEIPPPLNDSLAPKYVNPWGVVEAVRKLDYKRTEKIAAIKLVRQMNPGMGLAEAKWFVEALA